MGSFVEGVRMSDLPQTFRDAIHVAKELGLSYIWIDALCIIQDDPEDWTIESSRMRSVYGNSYVNLAASSATNVHEGFFSKPEDYKYYSGGFCAPVSTTECSTIREFHSGSVYKENSESTHLATRAWTLQERLLPARTISFGVTGIFWECRSGIRSEFFPCGIPGPFVPHQVCPEDQAWYWDDIIAQYAAADLTNPEDKLPALAGIARRQQEATGHQYLAGMWKESLVTGIIWVVEGRRKRPAWRAPSWSWMAVDSQIFDSGKNFRLNTDGVKQYISVLDAWTTPSGPDRFGKVSDGLLSLACTALVRAHLLGYDEAEKDQKAKQTEEHQLVRLNGVNSSLPISMDVLEEESSCSDVYLLPVCGGPSGNARIQKRLRNNGDHEKNIRSDGNEEHNESDREEERVEELVMYGLVLRACGQNTGDSGRFSRVGSFSLGNMNRDPFSEEPDRNYYGEFMEVLDRRGHQTVGGKSPSGPERTDSIRRHLDITIE
ncbi:hypothetical protein CGCSCA4_v004793 [Colletotrichum siamense]|uniref:Heterokaryon incompatibility domain-containing protein n=1 Tax=Colletotrichum siamense TaxID=690259 RepID=A0A9P5F633_COLSI|nr:hypothetical protein CGCSCA4_v004793 [Colletotrichum siamense]KAF4867241.1 hypothetical protein CGCSCA2_v000278 [Colletotrichum siamense]